MKKFKFNISGNHYDVNVKNVEENIAKVEVNGVTYKVEMEQNVAPSKTPTLLRSVVSPSTESEKATVKTANPLTPKGAGLIKSPLPGTIISINIKEGDLVKIGDNLLILEAMKMENKVSSDKEGKVISIKVKPGDAVLEGDILIQIG